MFRKTLIARCLTLLILALLSTNLAWGGALGDGYTKITDISSLSAGDVVVLYCDDSSSGVTGYSGSDATVSTNSTDWMMFTVEKSGTNYYLKNSEGKYITKQTGNKFTITATTASGNECTVDNNGVLCINSRYLCKNGNYYRMYTSVGSYKGVFVYKVGTPSKTLTSIAISGTPNKTTYEAGEEFDPAGLVVTGTYDDESEETITSGITWDITPSGALIAGTTSVTVIATVDNITSEAYVVDGLTVNEHIVAPGTYTISLNNALYGISTGNNGTEQSATVNDITVVSGCSSSASSKTYYDTNHIRYYIDSYLKLSVPDGYEITSVVFTSGGTWNGSGISVNTGSYSDTDNKTWTGKSQNVDFSFSAQCRAASIKVTYAEKKTLSNIAVKDAPSKTTYKVGETFDPAGLVITATYNEGDPEDIAYADNESDFSFSPTLETALTTANENVTITYGGKSADQAITVTLNQLATPTNLNATPTSTSATLTWDAVANASSYKVNVLGDDYDETFTPTANSLLVEDLTASTAYIWTVKAIGDGTTYGNSDESAASEFTTSALPTVAYTVTFNGNKHGTPASGSITENPAGSGVTLPNCTPNAGYQFVGWATLETATEAEYEASAIYYPTEDITLYAVYNEVYTITWSVNGTPTTDGNPTTSVVKGDGITALPTAPASISGMSFQGWTATQIETPSTTAPTDLFTDAEHAPAITANTTFYAVFAEESEGEATWTEITSIPEAGTYAILTTSYFMKAQITNNRFANGSATPAISNNKLTTAPEEDCIWEISKPDTYYRIKNGNNYAGGTNSKNQGALLTDANSDLAKWSISYNSGFTIINYGRSIATSDSNNKYLRNNASNGWATYVSNTGDAPRLFKKIVTYTYTNYCTTVIVKELTSISLDGDYPTEFWKGDAFSHEGMTVTAHYNDESTKDVTSSATFTGYDMSTAGEQPVTVTYETLSVTYDITVKTIANTQETAYTVAVAKELINAGNDLATKVYVAGKICKIDSYNSPFNSITYWISTDGTQDNMFEVYSGKNLNNTDFTSISDIVLQADVIVYGKIKKFNSTYEFDMNNYLVSYTVPQSYTITLSQSTGGTISADKETAAAGETVTITIEPASGYTLATLTGATFNETVDPALLTYTFTMPAEEVTISATFNAVPTYTISFATNGIAETEATIVVNQGDAIGTLAEPTGTNIPNGYTFKGWSENEIDLTNVEPTYITDETVPTDDMTLYAVFAIEHKDIQETTSTMDFSEETYSDWIIDEDIKRTADQGTGGTGDYAGKINTNNTYITFNKKVKVESFGFSFKRTSTNENYNVYIETSTDDENWTARKTYPMKDFGNGSYTTKTDDTFDGKTDLYVRFHCYNTTANRYVDDVIIKYMGEDIAYSNFCTTVKDLSGTITQSDITANTAYYISDVTTINSAVEIAALTNDNPANLIIEDGAQLIVNNSGVKATVEKVMDKHGSWGRDENPKAGWYFLAAPMEDFTVASFIEQAGEGEGHGYDLYRWYIKKEDGTPIWYNYKANTSDFEPNFVSGRGYLAAYQTTDLLKMQGTLNAGTEFNFTNELNSNGNFTLLGNPFTYDLKWSDFNNKTGIYDGFAVVDSDDGTINYVVGTTPIKVGTGFMVYTKEEGAKLSFKKGSGSGKSNDILALNLFASNGNGEDNTIIVIDDENGGFAKADNFNTNVPQIYTERLQTKYGIRNFNTSTKEFNVSFKAAGEGSNTIRLETIGEFDYVHLYDKLLDVDVDMLLEGSYTFEASEGDDTHRFIVRIDKGNTGIDENETENFVNVYNGEIHVSGSGEVQIFDVMGRMVHSEVISGDATISTGGFKGGVYVVRLIGDGWTKTEKIVVRR